MTPIYGYSIASGWDVLPANQDNLEDVVTDAPVADALRWGSVKRVTLDQRTQYNGTPIIYWRWTIRSRDDLNTLLGYLGSDPTIGSGPVTITSPNQFNSYSTYNCYMTNPDPGGDYQRDFCGFATDLVVEFRIVEQAFGELLLETGFDLLLETGDALLLE